MSGILSKWFGTPQREILVSEDRQTEIYNSPPTAAIMEKVLLTGDLASLDPAQRLHYYNAICHFLKLNPLTRPFDYITLEGKLTLYAKKDCTDQLRKLYDISIHILSREANDEVFSVVARAMMPNGRQDESIGAVFLPKNGEDRANVMMKAETKAKRRATLSICGLGMFDESEIEEVGNFNEEESRRRVTQATENRVSPPLDPVTEENYNEVICHIGQAKGNMLGKKVGQLHPNVLTWLQNHFGEGDGIRWGNPSDEKDLRLKKAIDLAIAKLKTDE